MKTQAALLFLIIALSFFFSRGSISRQSGVNPSDDGSASISSLLKNSEEKIFSSETPFSSGEPTVQSEPNTKLPILNCGFEDAVFRSKAILARYLDNQIRFLSLNTNERWPIASLSKLMTAVIAIEKLGLDKKVTMSDTAVNTAGEAGNLNPKEIFTVQDLIKVIIITSSNDAAAALSESLGQKEFVNEMRNKAAELKMTQTTFVEPTGLSFLNQSTAEDLEKLVLYINLNYPEIFDISRVKNSTVRDLASGKRKTLTNINQLAGQTDFLGGKTGHIEEADYNLIALFNINGKEVLTVILGASDIIGEMTKLKNIIYNCQS